MQSHCPNLSSCPFFEKGIPGDPGGSQFIQRLYCHLDHPHCARKIVRDTLGAEQVPVDLYPHDFERAKRLINNQTRPNAA